MRQLIILILTMTLIPSLVTSQTKNEPQFYLNGKEFDINSVFLPSQNIESIKVKKDKTNGEIFITTKEKEWKYKTLDNLLKTTNVYSQIFDKSVFPVFIIDGKLVKNIPDIKIDDSYFAKVSLSKLSQVTGLEEECKKIIIIQINLTLTDPKKEIYIRGTNDSLIDSLIKQDK